MGRLVGASINPNEFSSDSGPVTLEEKAAGLVESGVLIGDFSAAAQEGAYSAYSAYSALQAGWPQPHAKEAFHGLAGDFVNMIGPETESDPAGLLVQFLVAFGSVLERGAFFLVEATPHYSNLYAVLVGETSKSRKGTSWGHIKRVFRAVDADWVENRIKDGLSSGEGLIWAVRDPLPNDSGVEDKRLLIAESEFVSCLKVMKREGSTLSPVIRDSWDHGDLNILNKNSPAKATNAHISLVGHITVEELKRYLDSTEYGNGYGNRHLFCCVRRSQCLPEGGNLKNSDLAPLIDQLSETVEIIKALGAVRIEFDEEARDLWHKVYPELSAGKLGLLGAITARAEAQVIRLACVYALLDLSFVIKIDHLKAAFAVWDYCEASCRYIFGNKSGDPVADEILRELRNISPEVLNRTDINKMFKGHKRTTEITQALNLLQSLGLAKPENQKTGGRSVEEWVAI